MILQYDVQSGRHSFVANKHSPEMYAQGGAILANFKGQEIQNGNFPQMKDLGIARNELLSLALANPNLACVTAPQSNKIIIFKPQTAEILKVVETAQPEAASFSSHGKAFVISSKNKLQFYNLNLELIREADFPEVNLFSQHSTILFS